MGDRRFLLAVLGSALLASSVSRATSTVYTVEGHPVHWQRSAIPFAIDPSADEAGEAFQGLAAIVARASEAWRAVPNVPRVDPVAEALGPLGYDPNDAANRSGVVVYRTPPPITNRNVLAVTLVTTRTSGEIVDTDVVFNAGRWSFAQLGPQGALGAANAPYDVANVLTHEMGHVLGLTEDPAHQDATMYPYSQPGQVSKRVPTEEDQASLAAAYVDATAASMNAGCGGSHVAPMHGGRRLTLGVIAVALLALAAARRRFRRVGVVMAAGAFLVVAAPDPVPPAQGVIHRVVAVSAARRGGFIVTHAVVEAPDGTRSSVELLGGRVGDLEQHVFDAPSGTDVEAGGRVEIENGSVRNVLR